MTKNSLIAASSKSHTGRLEAAVEGSVSELNQAGGGTRQFRRRHRMDTP